MNEQQEKKPEKKPEMIQEKGEMLIRILATDITGSKSVYAGLTRIKGISWAISNAACRILGIPRAKKIKDLNEAEIETISKFIANPKLPEFMLNRRKDLETGKTEHLIGTDLDMRREFDIKRMKKMRSYKGVRHSAGQPVRGQRTKSHFRKAGKAVGVVNKPTK